MAKFMGIDVGSTTVKVSVLSESLASTYSRIKAIWPSIE